MKQWSFLLCLINNQSTNFSADQLINSLDQWWSPAAKLLFKLGVLWDGIFEEKLKAPRDYFQWINKEEKPYLVTKNDPMIVSTDKIHSTRSITYHECLIRDLNNTLSCLINKDATGKEMVRNIYIFYLFLLINI